MIHHKPKQWVLWLSLAQWWYNTCYHQSIKASPFQALYGYEPPQLSLGPYLQTTNTDAQTLIQDRQRMIQVLRENMLQAQNRMKQYANKSRSERNFKVGDWVFLRIQPFKHGPTQIRRQTKLSVKYLVLMKWWKK